MKGFCIILAVLLCMGMLVFAAPVQESKSAPEAAAPPTAVEPEVITARKEEEEEAPAEGAGGKE